VHLLGWIALVPLLLALRTSRLGGAVALATLWGMLSAYGVTDWLPPAVASYYHQPLWLGAILFASAAFLMGAVEYAAFGAYYWWAARRSTVLLPMLSAAAWSAAELGRGRLFTGNPWGLLGYTQSGIDAGGGFAAGALPHLVVQVADWTGVYGVSFVLVAVNTVVAETVYGLRAHGLGRGDVARWLLVVLLLAATLAHGVESTRRTAAHETTMARVAVAQGNLDLGSQWRSEFYGANLDVYLELTRAALHTAPAVMFWPENAITFFVDAEPEYRTAIASVIGQRDVELVAGAPRFEAPDAPVYFNSAFLLSPRGAVVARYDKEHLLPFAEYFPFASSELLRRSFARVREFSAGRDHAALPTRIGRAAITICNEAMFPEIVTARVREGVDYVVNLTNDTWIQSAEFAEHQLAIVAMRAVEHRTFLVRASTSGPSAIVDPTGIVVARTATGSSGILAGSIEPRRNLTPYARHGDWLPWSGLLLVTVSCVVWRRAGH
jgi:apolipoprotein N-acyltransferase